MSEDIPSAYWLDQMIDDITAKHPDGKLIVASGHSPSGTYHIGSLREIMTADLITWALRERGREAVHIDFIDDLDALRKVPANVPEHFREFAGQPLYLVPDPENCHGSYAEHFLEPLNAALDRLGIRPERLYAHELYAAGRFTKRIEETLIQLPEVREIITEVGSRDLDERWVPVQLLSGQQNLRDWQFDSWDRERHVISYRDEAGQIGELDYRAEPGRVKLDWRLDWPARWAEFGVTVEPFGRDHASKGGSYDTGQVLVGPIFGDQAPYPVPYEFVTLMGETKKMSKSSGNVVTPAELLAFIPPEILRYLFAKPRPGRQVVIDTGAGMLRLRREYELAEAALEAGQEVIDAAAVRYAQVGAQVNSAERVPFAELLEAYQAGLHDRDRTRQNLERLGHTISVEATTVQLVLIDHWLETYAPEEVKFTVQDELPEVELSSEQTSFLDRLATKLEAAGELDGQRMHELIYAVLQECGIKPSAAFAAIYRVILTKDAGPKAGWFLVGLDRDWLIKRLRRES